MTSQKIIKLLIFIIFLAGLFPFLILAFYNHPSADDYLWTAMVMQSSIWDFQIYNFYEWSGRYFSNFLVSINPLVFRSLLGYQVAVLFFISIFFSSIYFTIRTYTQDAFTKSEQLLGALVFALLFLAYTPSVVELFYWFTGAAVYTSANTLFFIFMVCLFRLYEKSNQHKNTQNEKIIMSITTVLMMWSNEIIIIGLGGFLFLINCSSWYYKHATRYFLLGLFFLAIAAALASILAPGNAARAAVMFPNKFNIPFAIQETFKKFIDTLFWVKNVPLWIISLLFIPICTKLSRINPLFKNHFYVHPIISIAFWLSVLALAYFPIHLATGQEGIAMRVRATNYLFFIMGWFINLFILVAYFQKINLGNQISHIQKQIQRVKFIYVAIPLLFFFSYKFFSINSKVGKAWEDLLSGTAKTYDEKMKQRYTLLKAQNTNVPYIQEQPFTLYFADLEPNVSDWKNRNCAIYFGVDSINVVKNSPQ